MFIPPWYRPGTTFLPLVQALKISVRTGPKYQWASPPDVCTSRCHAISPRDPGPSHPQLQRALLRARDAGSGEHGSRHEPHRQGDRGARSPAFHRVPAGGGDPLAPLHPRSWRMRNKPEETQLERFALHARNGAYPGRQGRRLPGLLLPGARLPAVGEDARVHDGPRHPGSRATSWWTTTTPTRRTTSRTAGCTAVKGFKQTRICAHVRFRHRTQQARRPNRRVQHAPEPAEHAVARVLDEAAAHGLGAQPAGGGAQPRALRRARARERSLRRRRRLQRAPGLAGVRAPRGRARAGSTPSRSATS